MSNYSEKLRDPRWQKKRLEILNRDKFTCQCCKTTEIELHIHHIEYRPGEPWDIDTELLITLCKDCHKMTEDMGGGAPPAYAAWGADRKYAMAYHENYVCYVQKGRDFPIWQANERYIRLIIETMPEGWLESARDHSERLLKIMQERAEQL